MENQKTRTGMFVILALAGLLVIVVLLLQNQAPRSPVATPAVKTAPPAAAGATPAVTAGPTKPAVSPTPVVLAGGKTTASGLQYLELTPGTGEAPKAGYIVTMHYIAKLADGTELANTYTDKQTASAIYGKGQLLAGWEEALSLMKVGGKMRIVIPPNLAVGPQTASAPPDGPILMDLEIVSIKPAPVPSAVAADKLVKTASGLQYYDLAKGDGATAGKNYTVSTGFILWIKTDSGYDYVTSSEDMPPISFKIGGGDKVFPGWEEGATDMKVGGKRLLVIPPDLGMGAQGSGDVIPPNATLVMEITLLSSHEPAVATKVDPKDYTTTKSGLKYVDLKPGAGAPPAVGQTVVVNYTGWLVDGTQFDSSLESGQPFSFQVGKSQVIPGWDEGVAGMQVGGKRQLVIPPELGYGASAQGPIPANSTLIFEVELLSIQN